MVAATLTKNSNAKTEQWLKSSGRKDLYSTCNFLCPVKLMLRKGNFFSWNYPLSKRTFHSLIPLKKDSTFMRFLRKLFILTLKLLNVLKSSLCLKEIWQISRVNNPKTIRIENTQLAWFCLYMSICVAHFPYLY